jgi:hypothetical protein
VAWPRVRKPTGPGVAGTPFRARHGLVGAGFFCIIKKVSLLLSRRSNDLKRGYAIPGMGTR